jgi:hypothetical protein
MSADLFRPIFEVKTDLDPFLLYGSINDTSILEEPCDPRLRLATLKAIEKLEAEVLFKKVEVDKEDKDVVEAKILSGEKNKRIKPTKTPIKVKESVDKCLSEIESTFSNIFSALLGISDNPKSCQPDGQLELDRVETRGREFESRLKRSLFETKQEVCSQNCNFNSLGYQPSFLVSTCVKRVYHDTPIVP